MPSVTQRVSQIKQPRGGYLKPKDFTEIILNDGVELYSEENIHPSLVGLAVDYMTRYTMGTPAEQAFKISMLGSSFVKEEDEAKRLLKQLKGLDDQSILNACKLVGYDVCCRASIFKYQPVEYIHADEKTIHNVRTMVNRSLGFWEQFGPIIKEGFTFESAYTPTVTSGDGDYLTEDTLWDFKVSKNKITNKHTLQLLMYYILGSHSIHKEFHKVKKIGVYNPRLNMASSLEISQINPSVIKEVATDVVGIRLIK